MIADMPRKCPLHVTRERTRHDKWVYYFRVGKGERTRLPDLSAPEFDAAYKAALTGNKAPPVTSKADAQSLSWLVDRYRESARWAAFAVATRKQQGLFFQQAIKTSGNADFRDITSAHIEGAIDDRGATPHQANNFLKAMKGLFAWAKRNGHVEIDPCVEVEGISVRTEGFPPWTMADAVAFCHHFPIGTQPRLAFELLLQSGLRRSDIVHAGRQHMSGNVFSMRTAKTNIDITVEFPESLLAVIAATPSIGLHFISNAYGRPFTKESFGNWFRDRCREAGIEKSAHGVRKLSATMAADGGATTHELMAMFGWVNTRQAENYTKGADRKRLGVKSSRLVAEQIEATKAPHLDPSAGKSLISPMKSKAK